MEPTSVRAPVQSHIVGLGHNVSPDEDLPRTEADRVTAEQFYQPPTTPLLPIEWGLKKHMGSRSFRAAVAATVKLAAVLRPTGRFPSPLGYPLEITSTQPGFCVQHLV